MNGNVNEMDEYGKRNAAGDEADVVADVELQAGAEGDEAVDAAPAAAAAPGVSPKQKKLVLGGAAAGFALIGALIVANVMSGGQSGPAVAQYDQPAAQDVFVDQAGVLASASGQGNQAAPLFDGQAPQEPVAMSDLLAQGLPGQTAPVEAAVAPQAPQTQVGAPVAPAPFPTQALQMPEPVAAAAVTAPAAPVAPAAPASVAAPAVAPAIAAPAAVVAPAVAPSAPALSAEQAAELSKLRADNATLRSEVAELKRQVARIRAQSETAAAPKPAPAPVRAAAPAPRAPAASTAVTATEASTRTPQAQRSSGASKRGDFEIYAVTDGRVWVVGKDGERLGPLAVGSPLTDGSKITGIDIGRGVVLTTTGEIH